MEAQQVVLGEMEARGWREEFESVVRAMPVVIVEEDREACRTLIGVRVRMSVGPFAEGGLDKALGLAVGFWSIGASEALLEAESGGGGAHEMGAVSGAVIGIEALGVNAVS